MRHLWVALVLAVTACSTTDKPLKDTAQQKSAEHSNSIQSSIQRSFPSSTLDITALAFISYAGDRLINSDANVEQKLKPCLDWELQRQPQIKDKYSLAWGPVVHRLWLSALDDNMMYAVTDNADPSHVILAIRGTNPTSISDWLVEDFYVRDTSPWPYSNAGNNGARISEATHIGLKALTQMKPHGSSNSKTFRQFLAEQVSAGRVKKVTITGHSLAGALAPSYALYLHDTRSEWDTQAQTTPIAVTAIAGATPGNSVFAQYYDTQLGAQTTRLHNSLDVVPHAWYIPSMEQLNGLYSEHGVTPTWIEKEVLKLGRHLAKNRDYYQINASTPALQGSFNMTAKAYAKQAAWQHHCGYYDALGMSQQMYNTNATCLTQAQCSGSNPKKGCAALKAPLCQ